MFRSLREQKGLTHDALARLARCHRNTVINVESGRRVKFKTIAGLLKRMGYAADSPEMTGVALLWLQSVSGLALADPATLGKARRTIAGYAQMKQQAVSSLLEAIQAAGLAEREVRLLEFAAQRPGILEIVATVRDLLLADPVEEKEFLVAEDE